MGIFSRKEKIKASDLGKTLLVFVDVFNKQDYESIKSTIEEIQKESSLNFSQILFEYCCLKFLLLILQSIKHWGTLIKNWRY